MADAIRDEEPGTEVALVPMPAAAVAVARAAVVALRARLSFAPTDVVVGVFGLLTPEKRLETVARAVARAAAFDPRLRLMLAGPPADAPRLESLLERHGLRGRAVATGRMPLAELPVHVEAADVVAHLRYPTARETSAALLRVLAQGRATVVSDLEHQADLPGDAVVRADVTDETGELTRAILRLAGDPAARARLGSRAAEHVRSAHSATRVRDAWRDALERARHLPDPRPGGWPAHWPRP
jgi:glycosyltransferase involved in cell wall biosynthesis